jgi:hypothetical protein
MLDLMPCQRLVARLGKEVLPIIAMDLIFPIKMKVYEKFTMLKFCPCDHVCCSNVSLKE